MTTDATSDNVQIHNGTTNNVKCLRVSFQQSIRQIHSPYLRAIKVKAIHEKYISEKNKVKSKTKCQTFTLVVEVNVTFKLMLIESIGHKLVSNYKFSFCVSRHFLQR